MKIKLDTIDRAMKIIPKIIFNSTGNKLQLFFPLDLSVEHVDDFGIKSTTYKADTHYGSNLVNGLSYNRTLSEYIESAVRYTAHKISKSKKQEAKANLSYTPSVNLFSFNLTEYMQVIEQSHLTNEEKDFICSLECCVVETGKLYSFEN